MNIDYNLIFMCFLIIILISIQYTLNKILLLLKQIKDNEKKKIDIEIEKIRASRIEGEYYSE